MRVRKLIWCAVVVPCVLLAGCGEDPIEVAGGASGSNPLEAPAPTVAPTGETSTVLAVDNSFNPVELVIAAGTEVIWENRGRNDHNIIPEDEAASWRVDTEDFVPGDVVSHVFNRPGTYRYYCSIHGTIDVGMPGVIVVE